MIFAATKNSVLGGYIRASSAWLGGGNPVADLAIDALGTGLRAASPRGRNDFFLFLTVKFISDHLLYCIFMIYTRQ